MNIRTQSGISFFSVSLIVLVCGFFLLLGIKLFPAYMVDMNAESALSSLARQPGAADMTNQELRTAIDKRFQINDIDRAINTRKDLAFIPVKGKRIVRVKYDSITQIFNNVFVLIEFEHNEEIGNFVGQ